MNSKSIDIIIRLPKYNIGLVKEAQVLAKVINNYKFHKHIRATISIRKFNFFKRNSIFYFYNLGLFTFLEIFFNKLLGNVNVLCLHEPFMEEKINYGFRNRIKILIFEFLLTLCVIQVKDVILFSKNGLRQFKKKYKNYASEIYIQKLLPALKFIKSDQIKEKKIIFVGKIHKAKRFDLIIETINKLNFIDPTISFLIISRSINQKSREKLFKLKNIKLINEKFIPDETIWKGFAESMVLIKLDTNMTQSGLVSQARISLCKTLTTSIFGFNQDIYNKGVDGDIVPVSATSDEICEKILKQINSFEMHRNILEKVGEKWITDGKESIIKTAKLVSNKI